MSAVSERAQNLETGVLRGACQIAAPSLAPRRFGRSARRPRGPRSGAPRTGHRPRELVNAGAVVDADRETQIGSFRERAETLGLGTRGKDRIGQEDVPDPPPAITSASPRVPTVIPRAPLSS